MPSANPRIVLNILIDVLSLILFVAPFAAKALFVRSSPSPEQVMLLLIYLLLCIPFCIFVVTRALLVQHAWGIVCVLPIGILTAFMISEILRARALYL